MEHPTSGNAEKKYKQKTKTCTANGAIAYNSTGDARVDLFYFTARGIATEQLHELLEASWAQSPIDTVKIVFYNRDCRGGKGERGIFHESILWLHVNHKETVEKNFARIPFFGSWKDVSMLIGTSLEPAALQMFADQLKRDAADLESNPKSTVSLAAKWAPTEGHSEDIASKAAKKLAVLLSVNRKTAKAEYRKRFLAPLRQQIKITEGFMSQGQWDKIDFSKVPSRCMKLQRISFDRHAPELFAKYTEALSKGEAKVNATQLFPHEIVASYFNVYNPDEVLEGQWKVLIEQTRALGSLEDCLVVSDVSGSMSGRPMEVSIALGLLISSLTKEPFKDLVISFSRTPIFHTIQGNNLYERVQNLMRMEWGNTTNFNAVFTLILEKAKAANLPQSAMPKKLFVISDMQFDTADLDYRSNHKVMLEQYKEAGYEPPRIIYWNVNGAFSTAPVGSPDMKNVGLVSGFSPSILKAILQVGDTSSLTPLSLLNAVLEDKRYADLLV